LPLVGAPREKRAKLHQNAPQMKKDTKKMVDL